MSGICGERVKAPSGMDTVGWPDLEVVRVMGGGSVWNVRHIKRGCPKRSDKLTFLAAFFVKKVQKNRPFY